MPARTRVREVNDGQKVSWRGQILALAVGPVAHGGHCVARHDGRVIFVRHAIPGERARVLITEDRGGSFCRGDAIAILTPSPDRVAPPCRYAHPGGCGGCDFQHVALDRQRVFKAAVVAEQLQRLAGIDWPVTVKALDQTGLGWRRRVRYAVGPAGQLGLRAHRSHEVIAVSECVLGAAGVGNAAALASGWPGLSEIEVAVDDEDQVAVLSHQQSPTKPGANHRGRSQPRLRHRPRLVTKQVSGPERLTYRAAGRTFQIQPSGFWQTHPAAADAFTDVVVSASELRPGETAIDLYAGAGLFTAALAAQVGPAGSVIGLEADPTAAEDARQNLRELAWAEVRPVAVTAESVTELTAERGNVAMVVLDPPRTGAGRDVMGAILQTQPRAVIYVACDPAALARDVRTAVDAGWRLADLAAFDAFPMTHHVECIATLRPGGQ